MYTSATPYIDGDHPVIQNAVAAVAPASAPPTERAVRIHDFVRDQVQFGWTAAFHEQPASQVLQSGTGFCNTKGTLFVAMLRSAGIPARQHFVNIHASILAPFLDPGTTYVDHSFTEVLLEGQWLALDSYILDATLFRAAQRRLQRSGQPVGFGAHAEGTCYWDGRSNAFAQFVTGARFAALSTEDHGVHADIGSFYASGLGINRLGLLARFAFGFIASRANQRVETVRRN